jgi:hypothetical protein
LHAAAERVIVIRTDGAPMSIDDRAAQLELWSGQVNSAVVRVPGRRFPGVVIQGDSLSILFDLAMYVTEHLPASADIDCVAQQRTSPKRCFTM